MADSNEQIEQLTAYQRRELEKAVDCQGEKALHIIDAQAAALSARDQRVAELWLELKQLRSSLGKEV